MKVGLGAYRHDPPQMTCAAPWHAGIAHRSGYMLATKEMLESASGKSSGKSLAASGDQ
jgi:hypothetical protein